VHRDNGAGRATTTRRNRFETSCLFENASFGDVAEAISIDPLGGMTFG
jgi:hypothetical protein